MRLTAPEPIRFAFALALLATVAWVCLIFGRAHQSGGIADAGSEISAREISAQAKKKPVKKKPAKSKSDRGGDQTAQGGPLPRTPFTAADQEAASIANMPDARFWADSETEYLRALPPKPGPWLILSTGGEDGAFGAGLLGGWSKAGTRPEFSLVTGVSTGALIAPFAFLGSRYDDQLRDSYTTISAIDIFEVGGKGESFLDTWPLHSLIEKRVTPDLLKAIAAEHQRGRRLFILTTNLDAGRPVAWDIGAIATRYTTLGDKAALDLVRKIMIAAISIPGAFPPTFIEVEGNGRTFAEMHVDGGLADQFYIAPDSMLASTATSTLPATDFYIIANMKLNTDFQLTERSTLGILSRTVSTAIKFVTRNAIDRAYATAKRSGIGFHVAYVDPNFSAPARGAFDPDYMKALYEVGFARGAGPHPFLSKPADYSNQPKKVAR
ncbi:MAG: patatin-like phospholipase family protein [Pseudomonadota bacterium]